VANKAQRDAVTVISTARRWELFDFDELKHYRDLFYFLVWRDIKVLYAQTVLGFAWAILNPAVQIVVF
jgi:lipopolysaccharide transport system permease protein